MRNVYYGSYGNNGNCIVDVANGSCTTPTFTKPDKLNSKSPNPKQVQQQSMTNEETRLLTGFVAKTRAIFESRDNLDNKSNSNQSQSSQNLSFGKMSPGLLSTSHTSASVNKLNEAKIAFLSTPKQSPIVTSYTSVLKKTSNKENEKSGNMVNESVKNLPLSDYGNSNSRNSLEKLKSLSKIKSDAYSHENNSSNEAFINEVTFRPQDSSDYKYQNLSANSILTNNSFKPIISKFKKFSLAQEGSPCRTTATTNCYENECENDNSHNSSNEMNQSDLDKLNYNLATSVKQARLCFENLANGKEKSSNSGNSKPSTYSSIIKIKQSDNFRDRFSVGCSNNAQKSSDENSSASSVSSISSLNSYGSSVQNKISGEMNHSSNFAQLASRFNSSQITPSVSENTFAEKASSICSDSKNPNLRFTAKPDKNLSSPTHNAFSTCSSSSSSFDLHSAAHKSNNSSAVNSPRSNGNNNYTSSFSTSNNNRANNEDGNLKHKIVKLDNYVSHIAKEIISDYKEDSDSASGEEAKRLTHISKANLSPKIISVNKSVSRIKVIHDDKPQQKVNETIPTETFSNRPSYGVSRVRQLAQIAEKPYQRQSQPAETCYFKKESNEPPIVDNTSCVLPSKIKTRSHSLIDPKQVQMSLSHAINNTPQPKRIIRSASSAKEGLLRWCRKMTQNYSNVRIDNFSSSWGNGLAFCALIHNFMSNEFDYQTLDASNPRHNFDLAFSVAENKAGIVSLLDVDDMIMMGNSPDWKCVFTYVHSIYQRFKDEV